MNPDLKHAIALLEEGDYTCVICRGSAVYTDTRRGVRPLLDWVDGESSLKGFSAADRVVGRAAAFLYCILEVSEVYARVMSHPAAQVLRSHGIAVHADTLVNGIINRQGTGPCPFEAAVLEITNPSDALKTIRQKLSQMQIGGKQ